MSAPQPGEIDNAEMGISINKIVAHAVVNGFVIHVVMSGLYILAFACGMTAFGSGGGVWLAQLLGIVMSVFYFPVLLGAKIGLCEANIGPFPSLGTAVWCVVVGGVLYILHKKRQKKLTEQVVAPDGE